MFSVPLGFFFITQATAAFGALHYCFFFNQRVDLKDKGRVYAVLVLTILLHGFECWSLREDMYNRLRVFHNRCVKCAESKYDKYVDTESTNSCLTGMAT